jgi:hypothetical protein
MLVTLHSASDPKEALPQNPEDTSRLSIVGKSEGMIVGFVDG